MKKLALGIVLLIFAIPFVSADISQEGAVTTCRPYSSDSETITVMGPVVCDGEYWICQFVYYGNEQNVLLAVDTHDGSILKDNSDLSDVISTAYTAGDGSDLFDNVLTEYQFAREMGGMNSTLTEYGRILDSLNNQGLIDNPTHASLTKQITSLKEKSRKVAEESLALNNLTNKFLIEPSCIEIIKYKEQLNETLVLAKNFTDSWVEFINGYNMMASGIDEIYVASIQTSDVDLMTQSLNSISTGLKNYQKYNDEYVQTVLSNTKTRFERKSTNELLKEAYETLVDSNNPEAQEKYNEASDAFAAGDYNKASRLAREALLMPKGIENDDPDITVEKVPNYAPYIIAIGLLIGAIFVMVFLKKNKSDDDSEDDDEIQPKSKKPKKKGEWTWVKEKESSMEKRASKGTL